MIKPIKIYVTEKAAAYIKSRRLARPLVLVNLSYRSDSGEGCNSGCGGGGGCGEGEQGPAIPMVNVIMVDGGQPGDKFVKVDTEAGIPVYLAKDLYQCAVSSENPLVVDIKGLVTKRLNLEGIDFHSLRRQDQGEEKKCH